MVSFLDICVLVCQFLEFEVGVDYSLIKCTKFVLLSSLLLHHTVRLLVQPLDLTVILHGFLFFGSEHIIHVLHLLGVLLLQVALSVALILLLGIWVEASILFIVATKLVSRSTAKWIVIATVTTVIHLFTVLS